MASRTRSAATSPWCATRYRVRRGWTSGGPTCWRESSTWSRTAWCASTLSARCYGSTSAASLDPATGKPYGGSFPQVTVRDWVRSQKIALQELGIRHLRTAIGPSIGGMQALQWAVEYPEWVDRVVAMGTTQLSALGLGLNHLQREVMRLDPEWRGGDYYDGPGPRIGLAQARAHCDDHVQIGGALPRSGTGARPTARARRRGSPRTAGSILRATWSIRESCSGSALTPTRI